MHSKAQRLSETRGFLASGVVCGLSWVHHPKLQCLSACRRKSNRESAKRMRILRQHQLLTLQDQVQCPIVKAISSSPLLSSFSLCVHVAYFTSLEMARFTFMLPMWLCVLKHVLLPERKHQAPSTKEHQ
jgi:hypothetical protein